MIRTVIQNFEQIPEFFHVRLYGRCRSEDNVSRSGGGMQHELHEPVRVAICSDAS